MPMDKLFTPVQMGALNMRSRIVMAPLTRQRCPSRIPDEMTAEYYAQRASAGLIISEATSISQLGTGYPDTPCIYSQEQVEGWKKVTRAVHQKGGLIVCQLWHVGRISDPVYHSGKENIAPSAIKPSGTIRMPQGKSKEAETPRALELTEISGIIDEFAQAARRAKEAGFDGVEIHAANGYLLDQFMKDGSNHRQDLFGKNIEGRCRLTLDVVYAVQSLWDRGCVGLRVSPSGRNGGIFDSDPEALYTWLLSQLPARDLAYLHVVDEMPHDQDAGHPTVPAFVIRAEWKGKMILCGNMNREKALKDVANGLCDAAAFGKDYISNPDLVQRLQNNTPLTPWDSSTFYTPGSKGYTDYPSA